MKNKSCSRWVLPLGFLALVVLCVAAFALVYLQARARVFNSRPLVLIHSPVNHEQARVGDGIIVHATAREDNGLRRIELWANNTLVDARDAPDGNAPTTLVFSGGWVPSAAGNHVLIVRAIAADGTEGQTSVSVEALAQEGVDAGIHTVQEGETIETIAAEYGTTAEELSASNPDLEPSGPAPGDELIIPDDEPPPVPDADGPGGDGGAPPVPGGGAPGGDGSEPPVPDDDAPDAPESTFELMWFIPLETLDFNPGEPTGLRVEFLSLTTSQTYEQLHCYIGFADVLPRWYPDADGDQTTDESFAQEGAGPGGATWTVEGLSGDSMPIFYWPENTDLPVSVSCVGIIGGGTDSVELGLWENNISPDQWSGMTLTGGAPDAYEFTFRISRAEGEGGGGVPIWLDPTMTPPTNLTLAGFWAGGYSLYWSYEPRPDEEPIDGFRIYLNGTLQWVEPPDARTTALPSQWLFPCVEPYTFTVTAFREGYPDGPESRPTDPPVIIEADPENCQRVVYVTFLNLTTHDLGGDGDYEDRDGDVGPAYGYFYANDQQVSFDGRPGDFYPLGLSHNSEYVIHDLLWDWNRTGPSQFRVELAEDELLEVGFHIDDEDTGRCNDSDDPGCDDLVCEGEALIDVDVRTTSDERIIQSRDGRCEVSYTLALGPGFPAEGYGGEIPLPWLTVEDLTMAEASQIRIHVRNIGRASWPSREVKVGIARPTGEIVDVLSWADISLAPGETSILQSGTMDIDFSPICVILDPNNEVAEEGDRLEEGGILPSHGLFCMSLPDLVITDVGYDPEEGHLLVTVQNQSGGALENRTIGLSHYPVGGGPPAAPVSHPGITLGAWETTVLTMAANEGLHSAWDNGYVVTVDPDNRIGESNNDNNSYTVPGGTRLWLTWTQIQAPYEARNRVEYEFRVFAVSTGSRRQIADWQITQNIDWDYCGHDVTHGTCSSTFDNNEFDTYWFDIAGDEALEITVYVNHERSVEDDWGHTFTWLAAAETYSVEDGWGAGSLGTDRSCTFVPESPGEHGWDLGHFWEWEPSLGYWHEWLWYVSFNLCREDAGE